MKSLPYLVTGVEVLGDYRLRLSFEDGTLGDLDLSGREWRGVFAPLSDPSYFRKVRYDPEGRTIVWPNGADLAPETLYTWVTQGVEAASI
ncbi:MAG: DUF2442 domain-containing protein [Dehalococcoidia bacterium]